jgi:hypothetical protein
MLVPRHGMKHRKVLELLKEVNGSKKCLLEL